MLSGIGQRKAVGFLVLLMTVRYRNNHWSMWMKRH